MLFTKWGEELDKNQPLSEYPRPQFVRDSYFSLNGMWKVSFSKTSQISNEFDNDICVPFSPECPLSGVNRELKSDEFLIYDKKFSLTNDFNKGRVFINFGAVDQIATVYINGNEVGTHHGGYTPFSFEITEYLVDGENTLNVVVVDKCEENQYSRGKQSSNRGGIWYSKQSGIWQSVWLESTPKDYIKSFKITPNYDKSEVHFEFEGVDDVNIKIYDDNDLIIDTKDKNIKIDNFKSWSPESPFLYDVVFETEFETVKSYFGMRKFSIANDENGIPRLCLNNKPYFMNGLLDQGYYPDGYLTPPSNEALKYDVECVKECGFNTLRKHIKIEPMLWYHYCDINGIIVWQDMINGGGKYGIETNVMPFVGFNLDDTNYKTYKRTNEFARNLYYKELKEMVDNLYNCPCIALWTPFNEGWGQFDSKIAYEKLKEWDNTRIVDSTSGWHDRGTTDIVSKHIYFTPIKVEKSKKPWCLTEFGGLGYKVANHTFNEKVFGYKLYKDEKSLALAYEKLFNKSIIAQIDKGLSASIYTQVTDVEDELNGLMTYDRKVLKIDKEILKNINKNVKL